MYVCPSSIFLRRFDDGRACRWKALPISSQSGNAVIVFVFGIVFAAIGGVTARSSETVVPLTLGVYNGSVNAQDSNEWTLPSSTIDNSDSCAIGTGDVYLLFEFWRLNKTGLPDTQFNQLVCLLVARGAKPDVANQVTEPQLGQYGTMVDTAGITNGRAYQRVIAPRNSTTNGPLDWYVTILNLDDSQPSPYLLRVSCVVPEMQPVPCPRTGPDQPECGGPERGTCGEPPKGVARPQLNRVCYCKPGWGDVDCQTPVEQLGNGDVVSKVLHPDEWAYWQLSVPLPANWAEAKTTPALLVEMSRGSFGTGVGIGGVPSAVFASGTGYGGDPMLFVMPKNISDGNRVPSLSDFALYVDMASVRLQQNVHYILLRDLASWTTLQAAPPPASGANSSSSSSTLRTLEVYVAVYNNPSTARLPGQRQVLHTVANVTLRVRWKTGGGSAGLVGSAATVAGSSSSLALCPSDCWGRGNCSDPYDILTAAVGSGASWLPGPIPPTEDFRCTCDKGYGGPMCEGTLRNLTLSQWGDGAVGALLPGQWAYFVVYMDPSRFDVVSDSLTVQWTARDEPTTSTYPRDYFNPLLTANLMAFPRLALADMRDPLRRGLLMSYNKLFEEDGRWQPIQIGGEKLKAGYSYVFGIYNSDYVRQETFSYTFAVVVPSMARTWLHPYMSVVLGVTAAIILCLIMTLCRRLLQRYGWGPFRPRAVGDFGGPGTDGNGPRVQVAQMPPRQRGVPAHIIDTFFSYEYRATSAEKEQLVRNRRDTQKQIQTQPPAVSVAAASLQPAGNGAASAAAIEMAQIGSAPSEPKAGTAENGGGGGSDKQLLAAVLSTTASPTVPTACAVSCDEFDEPQCAVCLCEYEEGESITQLPCRHDFHGTCIRKWLQTHYTCPICRVSLLPDQPDGADPQQQQQQQQQLLQQQAMPSLSPPTGGPAAVHGAAAANPVGGTAASGAGAMVPVVLPVSAVVEAAETPPPPSQVAAHADSATPRLSLVARMMDSMRSSPRQSVSHQAVEMLQAPASQHEQQRPSGPWAAGPAAALAPPYSSADTLPEPAPAVLVVSSSGTVFMAAPPPPGSPQLLARGPTATMESPISRVGGAGPANPTTISAATPALVSVVSVGPSPATSPNRLAAGRHSAASSRALSSPTGAVDAALPPQLVTDEPQPQAPRRRATSPTALDNV